jgi:two-component system, OmpR family, phosphate regulon sensor histidine kinase PhoR
LKTVRHYFAVVEAELGEVEVARLLLEAARYLGETLEPLRVYERFREIMAEAIPHDGVVVSSFHERDQLIRCDYAWVDGRLMDVAIFPPLRLSERGGMQSEVIRTGRPLLTNDVAARVQDSGTYYDVDSTGAMRKVPDEGPPKPKSAMMLPIKHEGRVVGVVQLMSERSAYRRDQLELAEGIVAQLGAAVRNARLHEDRLRLEASAAAARATALERERAAQVLEAVGDGIFFVDEGGVIRFWNRAAETLTHLPRSSVQGRAVTELGPDWASLATTVPAAAGDQRPRPVTLPFEVDGRELWLSFVAVGTHDGIVYAFRDVTVDHQLEESRHEIIATVSHELRTPLTAVLGAAGTLLRSDIELADDDRQQLLEMIATQAARLSQVTESILLAGRIDRDEVSIETTRIHVDTVVRETVGALEANIPPSVRIEEQLAAPGFALGDANRLQQVLINLLDNAVKYAPDGERILVRTSEASDRVRIEVIDEGAGIAPADQERVFEKFYRSDSSRRLAPSGTGLGLYICRGLLERMGGRISVDSHPGAGSTFVVEMPAAR